MITQANNTQTGRIYSVKNKYTAEIRRYLQHKMLLSHVSPWYKKGPVAHSLAMCNQAFTNIVNDSAAYSLKKICEVVIAHRDHLHNILPAEKNNSYPNCMARLKYIVQYAHEFLNQPIV